MARATFLQIIPNERFQKLQSRLFQTTVHLEPRRGAIVDRNGRDLSISVSTQSLYADPKIIIAPKSTSRKLAKIISVPSETIYKKIQDRTKRFVWLERKLSAETVSKIRALNIAGLGFVEDWKRIYPNDSLLSQTLGFVNSEGQGLEGLELAYQEKLQGDSRKVSVRRDARGRPLMTDSLLFTEHPEGQEVQLTVDSEMQFNLESELQNVMKEFDAEGAVGVILDAKTSAIRAIAAAPFYDLNRIRSSPLSERRNKAVIDTFEPGSTMKTFVIAKALKEKNLQPNTKYFCENGKMKIGNRTIREADASHHFGNLTVSEILARSSNIGTTKIAFQLGAEKLREGYQEFGFGSRLGVDFPGEARGILHQLPWREHLLSNISIGHGITASPLQIANAYASVVNGGQLHRPYFVQALKNAETGDITQTQPELLRQVLTPQESSQMRMMLAGVTAQGGSGFAARVNGFIVGGKTGTAQKVNPNARGYLPKAYISSFAGFIPAHDPQYVIYVAVDHPKKAYYGSTVAAPLFSRIAAFVARREGMLPSEPLSDQFLSQPGVIQKPLDLQPVMTKTSGPIMPSILKSSLRGALHQLRPFGVEIEIRGEGQVSQVWPEPGESLEGVKKVKIQLE